MIISSKDIEQFDKVFRLNLINSITGIKPANLIGTKSLDGYPNLAVISSVVHIGSNPPIIGHFMRPPEGNRHTFHNIKATSFYSINHITIHTAVKAHFTSVEFPKEISEFDACQLTPFYYDGFLAPFVKESSIRIGMKSKEIIPISVNNTFLIVGEVLFIDLVEEKILQEDGSLDLIQAQTVGVQGLDHYMSLSSLIRLPYARKDNIENYIIPEK